MITSKKNLQLICIFILLTLVDQLIKTLVLKYYPQIVSINKGIIFGFVDNIYVVIVLTIIGVSILYFLYKNNNKTLSIPIVLILAGAVSNIIDRFVYGGVIDYINLMHYSQLNLADLYIFAGVIYYLYQIPKTSENKK